MLIVQMFPGVVTAGQSVLVIEKAGAPGPVTDMFAVSSPA